MAGLVVLSTGRSRVGLALGFRVEPAARGAEPAQACLSHHCQFQVPGGKACGGAFQEGRQKPVHAELRKEKYAYEAA